MLCNSEKIRSFVLFHVSYVRIYVRECVRACARWRNTKGVIARSRAATRGSVVVLFKYLFNGERGGRKGVDRAKLVPAETLYRGGKCPRGVVRTFAGRTSAILGTRSAQPALYPSHCAFSLYLSFLSSPSFFFSLRYACIYVYSGPNEEVFPGIEKKRKRRLAASAVVRCNHCCVGLLK